MRFLHFVIFLVLGAVVSACSAADRLRRADSFFGLHFDLHASQSIRNAGESLTEAMIDSLLERVQPDFIQVDCKGHPGISSYPTHVGTPVDGFIRDPLRLFRDVTNKRGVALYVHYSGVWDSQAIALHPHWGVVDANGGLNMQATSVFSAYADSLLIPQMQELMDVYHIDGAWIDGECWGVAPDYSEKALAAFRDETGIQTVPRTRSDPYFAEFIDFNRRAFRHYLKRYVDILHRYNPNFQITSNWAFSGMMPEKVEIDLDYLSGDFTPSNSIYGGAFEARCLAPQGKPWDLMAWSFSWNGSDPVPHATKSIVQLQQEAAEVLAMGGGFQTYFRQNDDLSIQPWCVPLMAELAQFCRLRQAFCHHSQAIPQIGLIYATHAYQRETRAIYNRGSELDRMAGILNVIMDGQKPVEILMDHHLRGRMQEYPLLILPEWVGLEPDFIQELLTYVRNGGRLVVIGAAAVGPFADALGVELNGQPMQKQYNVYAGRHMTSLPNLYQPVRPWSGTRVWAPVYTLHDLRYPADIPAVTVASLGKGRIAGIYFNIGKQYLQNSTMVVRDLLANLIDECYPEQRVRVAGSHLVHVALNKLGNRTMVHLINASGAHKDCSVSVYDEAPALGPLQIEISGFEKKPRAVRRQPQGESMKFLYQHGKVALSLSRLEIYDILEIVE
jgi:hypothetical protein